MSFVFNNYIWPFSILLQLFAGRVLFAALVLSVMAGIVWLARKRLSPVIRSLLWALCAPALFLPFEHSAVFLARKLGASPFLPDSRIMGTALLVLSYLWLIGFIYSLIRTAIESGKTIKLLQNNLYPSCAAYFHKGRSHVYLPPDFERSHPSNGEREMILAHEKQHIRQHDPLFFRALQIVRCIFWFCPPIHMAIRLIRNDRELLCDERIMRGCSKREYGLMLLREARRSLPSHAVAGIASEADGMFERIQACAVPFAGKKTAAFLAVCASLVFVAAGAVGVANPVMQRPMEVQVSPVNGESVSPIDGAEMFVSVTKDGVSVDGKGLYDYMVAAGVSPQEELRINVTTSVRPALFSYTTTTSGNTYQMETLKSGDILFPDSGAGFRLWDVLYETL